jgi:hypothetical protein
MQAVRTNDQIEQALFAMFELNLHTIWLLLQANNLIAKNEMRIVNARGERIAGRMSCVS